MKNEYFTDDEILKASRIFNKEKIYNVDEILDIIRKKDNNIDAGIDSKEMLMATVLASILREEGQKRLTEEK
jgi:hypothetical protein